MAETINRPVIKNEDVEMGKLTDTDVKEAEKLMEMTGEIVPNANKDYGLSRRAFHKELKKVMEVADVIVQVLDARDPEGCRSEEIETEATNEGKLIINLINKVDLVPHTNVR